MIIRLAALALLCSGCALSFTEAPCAVEFPALPQAWSALFGRPQWRVEWINGGGHKESADIPESASVAVKIAQEWPTPVLAWPYYPEKGMRPGLLKPAGALFPYDAGRDQINLSWQGGVEAWFYWKLAAADSDLAVDGGGGTAGGSRKPQYFDWPRFRLLFTEDSLREKIANDPWTADWESIAIRTIKSGFDKRRITGGERENTPVPVPGGLWTGTSPFAPPLFFTAGEIPVFPAGSRTETWFSAAGTLKISKDAWIFHAN